MLDSLSNVEIMRTVGIALIAIGFIYWRVAFSNAEKKLSKLNNSLEVYYHFNSLLIGFSVEKSDTYQMMNESSLSKKGILEFLERIHTWSYLNQNPRRYTPSCNTLEDCFQKVTGEFRKEFIEWCEKRVVINQRDTIPPLKSK